MYTLIVELIVTWLLFGGLRMYPRLCNAFDTNSVTSGSILSESTSSNAVADRDGHSRQQKKITLIGASPLILGFLLPAFSDRLGFDITPLPAITDWALQAHASPYDLIILFAPGREPRRIIAAAKELLDEMVEPPPFAVLADFDGADEVLAAFEFGARAYIPTSVAFDVIIEAIKLVLAGGTYYPPCVLSACANSADAKYGSSPALTPREVAVLEGVRQGLPNKLIARELGISESTIRVHVHRLMKKLKVQNRTQAAICAGLLDPQ